MRSTAILFLVLFILCKQNCFAQPAEKKRVFTHADTLRGSVTPERAWWDVLRYDIEVKPDYENKTIEGVTTITYKANKFEHKKMQIDLQEPLIIDSIFSYTRF